MIDTHVHVWNDARLGEMDWIANGMDVIRRPFGLSDLPTSLVGHTIDSVVLVQALASRDETEDLLRLADEDARVAGVVGWVDLTSPHVRDDLAKFLEHPAGSYLVGIRHQAHDEPDASWLVRKDVGRGLREVQNAGLAYELLVRPRELPAALELAQLLPELRLVVDHAGKPPVSTGELEPWSTLMAQLAQREQVYCKLSGLVTEANWHGWSVRDLEPYAARVLDWFGGQRVIFGSDWPVCLLAASYDRVVDAFVSCAGAPALYDDNARAVYRLPLAATNG